MDTVCLLFFIDDASVKLLFNLRICRYEEQLVDRMCYLSGQTQR